MDMGSREAFHDTLRVLVRVYGGPEKRQAGQRLSFLPVAGGRFSAMVLHEGHDTGRCRVHTQIQASCHQDQIPGVHNPDIYGIVSSGRAHSSVRHSSVLS